MVFDEHTFPVKEGLQSSHPSTVASSNGNPFSIPFPSNFDSGLSLTNIASGLSLSIPTVSNPSLSYLEPPSMSPHSQSPSPTHFSESNSTSPILSSSEHSPSSAPAQSLPLIVPSDPPLSHASSSIIAHSNPLRSHPMTTRSQTGHLKPHDLSEYQTFYSTNILLKL